MPKAKEKGRRSSIPHKGKNTVRQGISRRYSKRSEENIQNTERSIDEHRNRIDMHKGIIVKALLDSGATGMFMDRKMAAKYGFRL